MSNLTIKEIFDILNESDIEEDIELCENGDNIETQNEDIVIVNCATRSLSDDEQDEVNEDNIPNADIARESSVSINESDINPSTNCTFTKKQDIKWRRNNCKYDPIPFECENIESYEDEKTPL